MPPVTGGKQGAGTSGRLLRKGDEARTTTADSQAGEGGP